MYVCKIKNKSISVVSKMPKKTKNKIEVQTYIENFANKEKNGYMSQDTRRNLKNKLDCYFLTLRLQEEKELKNLKIQPTFSTLTLSSKQTHNDKDIKKYCLDRFIVSLKRKSELKVHLWTAETQKNGNIHFHFINDTKIDHKLYRNLWNEAQENLGYISEFEKKHAHRNPNSTDIERIEIMNNVNDYITKYISKNENVRKIDGRLHGCSTNIQSIKHYDTEINDEIVKVIKSSRDRKDFKEYQTDYFNLYSFDTVQVIKQQSQILYNEILQHHQSIFTSIYK
jgi:hypothetical protein